MSSEEYGDDENGETVYQVKKLSWESAHVKKTKHTFGKCYTKGNKRSKLQTVRRVQADEMSPCEMPETWTTRTTKPKCYAKLKRDNYVLFLVITFSSHHKIL